jgi:ring-1,2-phenylacetyl-CoA epoxidase subunit PaaC
VGHGGVNTGDGVTARGDARWRGGEGAHRDEAPRLPLPGASPLLFDYLLRLADNGLVLAQRLGEWVGKGPALEEDIASTNVGLDLLGQARLWLAYAGEVEARHAPPGRSEDRLAYFRDSAEFRNLLLVEQPNGHYGDTIARQFLFDQWHVLLLAALAGSRDARIASIAAKAVKEARYHAERSADWMIRLGDGTAQSHARMQAALESLWTYTGEMFAVDATERALVEAGIAADAAALQAPWTAAVRAVFAEATLEVPADGWMQGGRDRGGKQGIHTEHLSRMLAEMQALPRVHPEARW